MKGKFVNFGFTSPMLTFIFCRCCQNFLRSRDSKEALERPNVFSVDCLRFHFQPGAFQKVTNKLYITNMFQKNRKIGALRWVSNL